MNGLSRKELMHHLQSALNGGNWFPFFKKFTKVLSIESSVFVQLVLNLNNAKPKKKSDKDLLKEGFVRCSTNYIETEIGMTKKIQEKVLKELLSKKFITRKQVGMPAKRFIRVEIDLILRAIDNTDDVIQHRQGSPVPGKQGSPEWGRQGSPERGRHTNNTIPNGIRKPITVAFGNDVNSSLIGTYTMFHLECANKLFDSLRNANKVIRMRPKLKKWAVEFSNLECDLIRPDRIELVLNWYCKWVKWGVENYIPKAFSAKSFCTKFLDIEDAMERMKKKYKVETVEDLEDVLTPDD